MLRSPLPIVKASALDELLVMNFVTEKLSSDIQLHNSKKKRIVKKITICLNKEILQPLPVTFYSRRRWIDAHICL
jgi:hypothetical protein